jgi:hypothetical protein
MHPGYNTIREESDAAYNKLRCIVHVLCIRLGDVTVVVWRTLG